MTTNSAIYRVAASDLDSTLLHGSELSPENLRAIQFLKGRNVTVVLSTGRNFHHTVSYYRTLGLTGPMVTSDGALVSIPGAAGTIISEHTVRADVAKAIIYGAACKRITCLNFFRHGIYVTSRQYWSEGVDRHRELGRHFRHCTPEAMLKHAVYKSLLVSDNPAELDAFAACVLEHYGEVVDVIRNNPFTLEFISKGVSKVSGLQAVADYLGVDSSQVVAFGDGVNDVGMFRWAGLSVCMNHGHEAAKAAAKLVAPETDPRTNFAAAVAVAFEPTT